MKNKQVKQMIQSMTKTPSAWIGYYEYHGHKQLAYLYENNGNLYPHSWAEFGVASLTGEQMGKSK